MSLHADITQTRPALRLVPADAPVRPATSPAASLRPRTLRPALVIDQADHADQTSARAAVEAANRESASISALDARWILAVQVFRALEGGPAAVITPESRKRLLVTAERLGLRSFDAGLIIAIVQDSARAGLDPLGPDVVGRLNLLRQPAEEVLVKPEFKRGHARRLIAPATALALIAGGALFGLLVGSLIVALWLA